MSQHFPVCFSSNSPTGARNSGESLTGLVNFLGRGADLRSVGRTLLLHKPDNNRTNAGF